jgi:NAD(P)-dependent dehydrogenase (short-subunit alcohol dehydrogenase family)
MFSNIKIANMAAFLASSESSYITGQDIKVDGGLCAAHRQIPGVIDN